MTIDTRNPHIDSIQNAINDHEKRIRGLEKHPCKQDKRLEKIESDQKIHAKDVDEKVGKMQGAFSMILDEMQNLRMDLALNQQQNSFQDQCLEDIKKSRMEQIRNKWVVIGIIIGALVGLVGPLIILFVEHSFWP